MTKKCACCGIEKDVSEFHKNSRNKDGLHSYCKQCNAIKAKKFNATLKGKENVIKAQKKQFESGYFKYGKGAINNMSRSAEHRGVSFNLTEDLLKDWWIANENICFYCGFNITTYRVLRDYVIHYEGNDWEINRFKRFFMLDINAKINDMTIDRKDNSIGYEISNIVKSCWICNSLKSDFFTEAEMKVVGKTIVEHLIIKMKGDFKNE